MFCPDDLYNHVPSNPAAWLAELDLQMTIGGSDAVSAVQGTVVHSGTEAPIATYPEAEPSHLERAVAAAKQCFPAWSAESWANRRHCLELFAEAIEREQRTMAIVLACESGRPLRWAWREISYAVYYLRLLVEYDLPPRDLSRPGLRAVIKRKAIGVVGAIAPWNAPVVLAMAKIVNALLVGDTIVLRPSPFTPLTALHLGQLGRGIFPDGVFNVITGDASIGAAMTSHPDVAKISFTGSTATGKAIAAAAAPTLKKLTLELGGNDAAIALADADVSALAQTVYGIAFANCGHYCAAIKRLYVHESIYDDVCDAVVTLIGQTVMGTSFDPAATMGPLQNRQQFDRVWGLYDDAVQHGGVVLAGGQRHPGPGLFIPPTLVGGLAPDVRLVAEEQFGPVLPIMRFSDEDAAICLANDSLYGLGGSIWTRDVERGISLAERLEVGTGWVNQHGAFTAALPMPFAKESGVGIDYAEYGLAEHARPMLINALL
jgi:aldehyde dehydrogenase (NAD+)